MRAAALAMALLAGAAGAVPPEGVAVQPRRGFFASLDLGGAFTLGGAGGYSNLQPWVQLGAGYELSLLDGALLVPLGLTLGLGANARNCWAPPSDAGGCTGASSFTLAFFDLGAGVLFRVAERLALGPKALVGGTVLDPEPRAGMRFQVDLGLAAVLEYATALDHFSVSLELGVRHVLGPGITAVAIHPGLKYTF